MDHVAGLELPAQAARRGIDRVKVAVARPEEDRASGHHGAGEKDVERVGDGLREGLHAVQAFGLEAALSGRWRTSISACPIWRQRRSTCRRSW